MKKLYTLRSNLDLFTFDAAANMDLINQPLLMIAGSDADTLYMTKDAFAKATGTTNKELYLVNEYQHLTFVDAKDRRSEPEKGSEFLFAYPKQAFSSSNFNHPVYLSTVVGQPNEAKTQNWTYVVFPQGTYNRWHSHKTGPVLIATDGIGYHQIKGEKPQILHPGDVVYCPPGVVHWHGAAPGSKFAHIAISPKDNHEVTWYDFPVKEYAALEDLSKQAEQVENPVKTTQNAQNEAALYKDRR